MAQQAQGHQEGSRWINTRPTGKEVADWFLSNAPMHPGMDPARYVTGVVLIPAKEKLPGGGEQHVYVPYVKVETRVAYFWDFVRTLDGAVGEIQAAEVPRVSEQGVYNMNLPPGFFRMAVQDATGKFVHFLCCSQQVRVADAAGKHIMRPATGTKMVSLLGRFGVDENAIMKAETGAVGRALGMAGMLVLPGSGVATAEDMQEMLASQGSVGVDAQLPCAQASGDDQIRARIAELSTQLESEHPGRFEEVMAWAREKKIDTGNLRAHQLRGVLRALERQLESAST